MEGKDNFWREMTGCLASARWGGVWEMSCHVMGGRESTCQERNFTWGLREGRGHQKSLQFFFDLNIISPFSVDQTWTFVLFFARVSIWQTERVAQRGGKGEGSGSWKKKNRVCRQVEAERGGENWPIHLLYPERPVISFMKLFRS